MKFSKVIVALVIILNVFLPGLFYMCLRTYTEPTVLIGCWFAFTTGECGCWRRLNEERE